MRPISPPLLLALMVGVATACGSGTNRAAAPHLNGQEAGASHPDTGGQSSGGGGTTSTSSGGAGQSTGGAKQASSGGATSIATKGVKVMPSAGKVGLGENLQFTAIVSAETNNAVTWSVTEGNGGTITTKGLYTAPSSSGIFHVVATSQGDSTLTGQATVTVSTGANTPPALTVGVWANISPPTQLVATADYYTAGAFSIALDPSSPRTIYAGIEKGGIWKTTDGGSSWTQLGKSPDADPYDTATTFIDLPIAIAIDPGDPTHIYATEGVRGADNGFWLSSDSGQTWLRPPGFTSVAPNSDVTTMAVDPTNFKHILLGFHSAPADIIESTDGGTTWTLHTTPSSWPAGTFALAFLYDPISGTGNTSTWLVHNDAFWRSTDAGQNWNKVSDISGVHGATEIYYAQGGVLYSGGYTEPARSTDNGATWTQLTDGVPSSTYYTVCGDGQDLFLGPDYNSPQSPSHTITSPETDGLKWTAYQGGTQTIARGPLMYRYDSANHILYSANWEDGIWALKVQ
jgi:photosystem II stability/assembly factor-like uncharacterized protein